MLRCDFSTKVTEENVFILKRHILNYLGGAVSLITATYFQMAQHTHIATVEWIQTDRMPKREQLLRLGGGDAITSYSRLSAFTLENAHVKKLGETPSAMARFF